MSATIETISLEIEVLH